MALIPKVLEQFFVREVGESGAPGVQRRAEVQQFRTAGRAEAGDDAATHHGEAVHGRIRELLHPSCPDLVRRERVRVLREDVAEPGDRSGALDLEQGVEVVRTQRT